MKPRSRLPAALTVLFAACLLAEGVWLAAHAGGRLGGLFAWLRPGAAGEPLPGEPAAATVLRRSQFEDLIDAFIADGVGLGNTPYRQLKTDSAMINERVDGCLRQKPNLHKTVTQIRTALFEPFDPVFAFWDADARLSPEVQAFLDRYAFRKMSHTTNERGERIITPSMTAWPPTLILSAGTFS